MSNINILNNNYVEKRKNYLISSTPAPSLATRDFTPLSSAEVEKILSIRNLKPEQRITRSKKALQTTDSKEEDFSDILLVNANSKEAAEIRDKYPQLYIRESMPIIYDNINYKTRQLKILSTPINLEARKITKKYIIHVIDKNNRSPIENATIQVSGQTFEKVEVFTNEQGHAEIEIKMNELDTSMTLIVFARHSYWDLILQHPDIKEDSDNVIELSNIFDDINPLKDFRNGWGEIIMGLNQMPKDINGRGIKIAIIDSGCDNSHPLLQHIKIGFDFTKDPENPDNETWKVDEMNHGTHCAGVIAARNSETIPYNGFAPESEIHILKIFPFSENTGLTPFYQALRYCIDNDIDVINISFGIPSTPDSPSIADKDIEKLLSLAIEKGITCIAAAGNSFTNNKKVFYPASSPNTLSVTAIGSTNSLKANTIDSHSIQPEFISEDIFSPSFTCFGPEIDVCAPGVSIISTFPGGFFKLDSGTSMAAPHVTGFAALLLAHHPIFQNMPKNRQKVETLHKLIFSLTKYYNLGSDRTGAGLPILGPVVTDSTSV